MFVFLIMNCAGYLNSEDLLLSLVCLIFTVSKFSRCPKDAKADVSEHLF